MTQPAKAPARRRWCQFNLATLLTLLTLAAIWLGRWSESVARQREAVAAIKAAGGWVAYRHELEADERRVEAQVPGPAWLRGLLGDDYFQTPAWLYYAGEVQATDQLLAKLSELPTLERVKIEGPFTGEGLRNLSKLPHLSDLSIHARNLTNDDLVHLAGLSELQVLTIDAPQLTDDALTHLGGLAGLERLTLVGNFSDAGMRSLRELTNLQELSCTTRPQMKQLTEPTAVQFQQTPLPDAISFLQELHHIPFRFDERALAAAGLRRNQLSVSVNSKGNLRGVLDLMLRQQGLGWTTDPDAIVITTAAQAEAGRREVRTLQQMNPNLKLVVIDW